MAGLLSPLATLGPSSVRKSDLMFLIWICCKLKSGDVLDSRLHTRLFLVHFFFGSLVLYLVDLEFTDILV